MTKSAVQVKEESNVIAFDEWDGGSAIEVTSTRAISPYVVFAQPKAIDQWAEFAAAIPGLADGDQVLVMPSGHKIKITPMRFSLIQAKQYFLKKDPQGNVVQGSVTTEQRTKADGYSEEVQAAIIVYLPDGTAVPASALFKTVKCGAALGMKLAIEDAAKPEWSKHSEQHRAATAYCAQPWLRVVGTTRIGNRTGGKGFKYTPATVTTAPTGPFEWQAVKNLLAGGGKESMKELAAHYNARLADLGLVPVKK